MIEQDWNKIFTEAFHSKNVQEILEKMFPDELKRRKISKIEFEGIVVQTCSTIMKLLHEGKK